MPRVTHSPLTAILLLLALCCRPALAQSDFPRTEVWTPNGEVHALAVKDNVLYLGGNFNQLRPSTGSSVARGSLAAIDLETGLPTSWDPNVSSDYGYSLATVYALAIQGDTLYAGGDFVNVGGTSRSGLAAFDLNTGLLTPWNPDVYGVPYPYPCIITEEQKDSCDPPYTYVAKILPTEDRIFVSGAFNGLGGAFRICVASLDPNGGNATGWDPEIVRELGLEDYEWEYARFEIPAMAIQGDTLYAAGSFEYVDQMPRRGFAAIDANTAARRLWNPAPNGDVKAMATAGDILYLGGKFTTIGGRPQSGLYAANPTTGMVDPQIESEPGTILDLCVFGDSLYIAGYYDRALLKAIDTGTGETKPWLPQLTGTGVNTLVANADYLIAGGRFSLPGSGARSNLAVYSMERDVYVQSITPSSSSTNGPELSFHVRFNQPVQHFNDVNDLIVTHEGTTHKGIAIEGAGDEYEVQLTGLSGVGHVSLSVRTDSDVTAANGRPLDSTLVSKRVRVGYQAPAVLSITSIAVPDAVTLRRFTVVFDDNMQNFNDADDLVITHTGTSHGGVEITGSGQVYTVTLTEVYGMGSFTLTVNTASDIQDYWGYPLASTVQSASVNVDDRPRAISIAPDTTGPTDADTVTFTVQFDQPVQQFDSLADLSITNSGVSFASVVIAGTADTYQVHVEGLTGDGTLSFFVSASSGNVQNLRGSPMRSGVASPKVHIRNSGPRILSITPSNVPAEMGSYPHIVRFSDYVSNFAYASFQLTHNGTAASGVHVEGTGDTYTLSFLELTGRGILQLTIDPFGSVHARGVPMMSGFTTNIYVNIPPEAEHWGEQDYAIHTTDTNADHQVSLSELLRAIQFYNAKAFSCAPAGTTEDGYQVGSSGSEQCRTHDTDIEPQDWQLSLGELLRLIQVFHARGYSVCVEESSEDGFCLWP